MSEFENRCGCMCLMGSGGGENRAAEGLVCVVFLPEGDDALEFGFDARLLLDLPLGRQTQGLACAHQIS